MSVRRIPATSISTTRATVRVSRLKWPTLVVHGDADRILPLAATGKPTHELVRGSRLVVVEGGPHGLTWTHAEQVNRDLLDFLGQGN
jgi:non-heme chloroperoxidase